MHDKPALRTAWLTGGADAGEWAQPLSGGSVRIELLGAARLGLEANLAR